MAAGLAPDGESSVQTAIMHGKPENLGDKTAMARASVILTQVQLAALKIRRSSLSFDMPPTDTSSASPGETSAPGMGAALAVDIWTPLMRPAQDGSSANCSNQP